MIKCPACKSATITKYITCEESWYQIGEVNGDTTWASVPWDHQKRTPENDYFKCGSCGITWRTRVETKGKVL